MKTAVLVFVAALALFLANSPAYGEQPSPIPAKAIEAMEFFVGDWASDDFENGEKIGTGVDRRSWVPGRYCLTIEWAGTQKEVPWRASGIAGWDAKAGAVIEYWYGSQGQSFVVRYPLDEIGPEVWEGTSCFTTADGKGGEGQCRLTKTPDGFEWVARSTEDGKEVIFKSVARRVTSKETADRLAPPSGADAAPMNIPAKAMSAMRAIVGRWAGEDINDGKKLNDNLAEWRWASGKHCLTTVWSGTQDGTEVQATSILGWEPRLNAVVDHWFASDGMSLTNCYPLDQMNGNVWEGTFGITAPDGTCSEGKCRFTITADTFDWVGRTTKDGKEIVLQSTGKRMKGAEKAASPLQPLEWLIGEWEGEEYVAPADIGDIHKGDRVATTASYRWSLDRSILVAEFYCRINGKRGPATHEVSAWDPVEKKVVLTFSSPAGVGAGEWVEMGERAKVQWSFHGTDAKHTGATILEKTDADTYTWQIQDAATGDQKLPEAPMVTFHRKKGEPAGDLWEAYQRAAAGTWLGEGRLIVDVPQYQALENDPFTMKLSLAPAMEGTILTGDQVFEAPIRSVKLPARIVVGWDTVSRQVRLFAYWCDGFVEEIFLSRREGNTFFGTYIGKGLDWPAERWPVALRFSTPDSYEYELLDGPHKGKLLSSWKRDKNQERQQPPSGGERQAKADVSPLLKEYGELMFGQWECPECVVWGSTPGAPTVPIRAAFSWTVDGAALQGTYQVGNVSLLSLTCWDPAAGRLKTVVVSSTGDSFESHVVKEGASWVNEATVPTTDGGRTQIRVTTTFAADGKSHVNEYPDHQEVFTRVK